MSTDFLIHRNSDGQIVRAIPYANIMMIDIEYESNDPITVECGGWKLYFTLQSMDGGMVDCSQADAERYLAEWRAWWEKKAFKSSMSGTVLCGVTNTTAARKY